LHATDSGKPRVFVVFWEVISMRTLRVISCVLLAAAFSLAIADSAQAIKILMHGRAIDPYDPADPYASQMGEDRFVLTYLRTVYGYNNVDYMRGEFANPDGSTATGYDVIYLSSSMNTAIIRNKYEDSTVGVVNSESNTDSDNTIGNFMLSDDSGDYGYDLLNPPNPAAYPVRHYISILNPNHPLAGGLSGLVQVFRNPPALTQSQYGLGTLGGGVNLIAELVKDDGTVPESSPGVPRHEHAIYAADVGGALLGTGVDGSPTTAAGRRAHWFESDYGFKDLTADGLTLFKATIDWAAHNTASPQPGDYFPQDGRVDARDYVAWRNSDLFMDGTETTIQAAYDLWRKNFGNVYAGSGTSSGAVPEPASVALLLVCVGIVAARRHR
jgi:hypothetical protein